jgi:hypothetical protein
VAYDLYSIHAGGGLVPGQFDDPKGAASDLSIMEELKLFDGVEAMFWLYCDHRIE